MLIHSMQETKIYLQRKYKNKCRSSQPPNTPESRGEWRKTKDRCLRSEGKYVAKGGKEKLAVLYQNGVENYQLLSYMQNKPPLKSKPYIRKQACCPQQ